MQMRRWLAGLALLLLAACGGSNPSTVTAPGALARLSGAIDYPLPLEANRGGYYKVGTPYVIAGRTYTPRVDYAYDEVGVASWYGPNFHGRSTANGELFDQTLVTAAHRTLPMPSLVRVTNLDNGQSIFARVNDRGPFAHDRIIDMSRRGAQLLGFENAGTARVRVQLVEFESRQWAEGRDIVVPAPGPLVAAAPPGESLYDGTAWLVRAGLFSERSNALRMRNRLHAEGPAIVRRIDRPTGRLYEVVAGPFINRADAESMRLAAVALGVPDAHLIRE